MQITLSIVLVFWCLSPLWFAITDGAHGAQSRVSHIRGTANIAFVGDVMLGGGVAGIVRSGGPDAPFEGIARPLDAMDGVVGNLECSLSTRGRPSSVKSPTAVKARREWLLRGAPAAAVGLAHARFAAMSLANNHTMDFGPAALQDTIQNLEDHGIGAAGAGTNTAEASRPANFERAGVRFALLAYSDILPRGYAAGEHTPGVSAGRSMASGLIDDLAIDAVRRDVANARRNADVVIIYEHWGEERVGTPSPEQERLARAAIDAGASVVVGAHPHVLGPIERYHRGIIAYSLGNFVFDAFHGAGTRSAILEVSFEGARIASWHVAPVEIYGGVPYPLSPGSHDAKLIESAIASRPGPIEGTAVPRHIGKRSGRPGGSRLQPIPL